MKNSFGNNLSSGFLSHLLDCSIEMIDMNIELLCNSGSLKIGANNSLNTYYFSFLGGPAIGGFYYTSVTFEF